MRYPVRGWQLSRLDQRNGHFLKHPPSGDKLANPLMQRKRSKALSFPIGSRELPLATLGAKKDPQIGPATDPVD